MKTLFAFISALIFASVMDAQLSWETVEIPMTDGYGLAADIYLPENWTSGPVVLVQTPYNKDFYHIIGLPMGIFFDQDESNYAFVIMDWRGFHGSSDDDYSGNPSRGEDGYDCVQWIASQTWCDGNVGTWGPSALGRVQYMTARENPPNLKCMVPLVAGPQYKYEEYYPGGVYRTEYVDQLDILGFGMSPVLLANPYYNLLWTFSEDDTFYPSEINVPALMIGGWYDHNVEVMLDFFTALQTESPIEIQDEHRLLFGPWTHGGSGTALVGDNLQGELDYDNAEGWSDSLALAFFDFHMRNIDNGWDETAPVQYYQMGTNEWNSSDSWPPSGTTPVNLYFHPDQTLRTTEPQSWDILLSYNYDPQDPSPTIGGPTLRNDLDQGPYDQAPLVESRNDLLVFSTEVLDADVVLKGQVEVHLHVSSTSTDTDFAARLCDVYPDGRSMLIADGIFRMRFREGFTSDLESFMSDGENYSCDFNFPNSAITILEGHRLRIDISSSNYPRFNRNMNNGDEMYPAMNGDTLVSPVISTNFIHTSPDALSFITLPLVGQFPDFVEASDTHQDFNIFPNPARDGFMIQTAQENIPGEYSIFEYCGKCVSQGNLKSMSQRISTSELQPGVYLVVLSGIDFLFYSPLIIN